MKNVALALCMALTLVACANPDTAVFVTSTSLGINADSKPPTVAVAYERQEGFIGPRFENGGAPPVVASMETAGNVFSPQIRQTYATGAAAINATTNGGEAKDETKTLEGPRKLMFFGTGTTLGFKVGFGPEGAPDSVVFGYRRKEISVIPLGITKVDGKPDKAVYPSVLASIDTTSTMTGMKDTGLANKQFFATGHAAEVLAKNPLIRNAFKEKAAATLLLDDLTPEQKNKVLLLQSAAAAETDKKIDAIVLTVSCDGLKTLNEPLFAKLVDDTDKNYSGLKALKTPAQFKSAVRDAPAIVDDLYRVATTAGRGGCPK